MNYLSRHTDQRPRIKCTRKPALFVKVPEQCHFLGYPCYHFFLSLVSYLADVAGFICDGAATGLGERKGKFHSCVRVPADPPCAQLWGT